MQQSEEKLRIDKFLWAIRVFKTRSICTEACKAGKIKLEGQNIKPSHVVKLGEVYVISKDQEKKIIKVIQFLSHRVDAKTAINYYEDLSPISDLSKFPTVFNSPVLKRDRGTGRPTKKDRRDIDDLQGSWEDKKA